MHRVRRAYTLFQLLVLLAFLALLLGMMMPATLRVRAAATRVESMNNLKQLGIAVHNHESAFGHLPQGQDAKGFSGLAHLLPYMEQERVYRAIDFNLSADDMANAKARETRIKIFESPQDEVEPSDSKSGPTSYFLVAGSGYALKDNDGIFLLDKKLRFGDILDGTSNTMMLLESLRGDGQKKAVTVARQHVQLKEEDLKGLTTDSGVKDFDENRSIVGTRGASWMEGRFLSSTINVTRSLNDAKPDVDCGGKGGLAAPRSLQPGTLVGLADSSVRFVGKSVSFVTWKAMATRAGGEVVILD